MSESFNQLALAVLKNSAEFGDHFARRYSTIEPHGKDYFFVIDHNPVPYYLDIRRAFEAWLLAGGGELLGKATTGEGKLPDYSCAWVVRTGTADPSACDEALRSAWGAALAASLHEPKN